MEHKRRILVAALDWGLGHATRCVPVINALLERNAEVIIASSGAAGHLLKTEFPALHYQQLPAYNPQYPANGNMVAAMARQLPHFMKVINEEHLAINQVVQTEHIDVVIADNRYGAWSKKAKSVFIGHQLNILMPEQFNWMEPVVNYFNRRQLNRFDACWVPAPDKKLLGALLPRALPSGARYIGYLSRFKKYGNAPAYDIVVIASGPEPQRSLFTDLLRPQLIASGLKTMLVSGKVEAREKTITRDNFTEVNFLPGKRLNEVVSQGKIIVARPGYSTIMDIAAMGQKAIFIPTPGQTEQQYLAQQLTVQNIALSAPQTGFNLQASIKESEKFSGFTTFASGQGLLQQAIDTIL